MQSAAADLPPDLTNFPPETRELIRAAWPEAARLLPEASLAICLDGAHRLVGAGVGLAPLVSYLRTVPAVAKQGGDAVLTHTIATAVSIATHADGRATDAFLSALPTVARRLITTDALLAFLDVIDEITALAPRGLPDLF